MDRERLQDKVRGSLVGGACGDAFGYAVEFVGSYDEIRNRYGEEGLTDYDISYPWNRNLQRIGEALISDDTQMTLYTAEGLLEAEKTGRPIIPTICEAYLAWFGGQTRRLVKTSYVSELSRIEELNQNRAPGNTCLTALKSIYSGREPMNNSKGCGGIMRVAPVGLYGASHGVTLQETARIAGASAELTHLHRLSTYSSAAMAVIVQLCASTERVDEDTFKAIVAKALDAVAEVYGEAAVDMGRFRECVSEALSLSASPEPDWEIIENKLGGGWVAEETLAIALFSVLRHIDDFNACLICAVNHGGDSDSTGSVAGNIIGAMLGYDALPDKFVSKVQFKDLLLGMADKLTGAKA